MLITIPQARAERAWSLQGILGIETGVSDNLNAGPEDPPEGVAPRDGGAYTTVAPGLLFLVDSPKQTHELAYAFGTTLIVGTAGSESLSSRAEWRGMFRPVRTVAIRTSAQWLHTFASDNLLPNFGGGIDAISNQYGQATSFGAQESLSWFFARDWRVLQTATGRAFAGFNGFGGIFDDDTTGGADGALSLGVERLWEKAAIGAQGGIGYVDFARPGATGDDGQAIFRATAIGRGDLTRDLSVFLSGGATSLVGNELDPGLRAVGQVALGYRPLEGGFVQLGASRDVIPNLFIAHTVLTDQVFASARFPATWLRDPVSRESPLNLSINGGVGRSRAIDLADGGETTPWDVVQASLNVSYQFRRIYAIAGGYSYARQSGNPMIDNLFLPFERHLVTVSLTARYPDTEVVRTRLSTTEFFRVDETTLEREPQRGLR